MKDQCKLINKNTSYITRDGNKVRIYSIDGGGQFPVHGAIYHDHKDKEPYWVPESWTSIGNYSPHSYDTENDLIEYNLYSSFKLDDKVFYQTHKGGEWLRGHFSHVIKEQPAIFIGGRTSFTNIGTVPVFNIKPVDNS